MNPGPRLIVFYKKSLARTKRPIIVSNGMSEIQTDRLILNNIPEATVVYNSADSPKARRIGATTPLVIPIFGTADDCIEDPNVPVSDDEMKKEAKRQKERGRYRALHPNQRSARKA